MSERLYRTIFENTGTAMLMFDEDENIFLANKKAFDLMAYSSNDSLINTHWSNYLTEESLCKIADLGLSMGVDALNAKRSYELGSS
jgi:PAS domain S-box-containing protein